MNPRLDELHADICKVFTSAARIQILDLLRTGERPVGEIAHELGLAQPTVSQHLMMMRSKGVLVARREGATVHYRVADRRVLKAFDIMRQVLLERLQEAGHLAQEVR